MLLAQTQRLIEHLQLFDKIKREWIPFKLWERQKQFHKQVLTKKKLILLKKRQVGGSQLVGADSLLQCLILPNFSVLILSKTGNDEGGDAKVFLDRIRQMYQKIPTIHELFAEMENGGSFNEDQILLVMLKEYNPAVQGANAGVALKFANGAYILSLPASKGRGMTADRIVIDEAAHIRPNPSNITLDVVFENVEPALDKTDGQLILISTANGLDLFSDIFMKALNLLNDFVAFFFSCWDDPTFNLAKRDKIRKNSGEKHANQEYPRTPEEAFIASGSCRFDSIAIQFYADQERTRPLLVRIKGTVEDGDRILTDPNGEFEIFKKKKNRGQYMLSADVAEGLEHNDYSVAKIYDRSTWEQVACWRGHLEHAEFGKVIARLGRIYNNAILVVENNNHGHSALTAILQIEHYPEELVFTHAVLDREREDDEFKGTLRFGWMTTAKNRPVIISNYANLILQQMIPYMTIQDLKECRTFVKKKGGKYEAEDGFWDDCVLTNAIGYYLLENDVFNEHYPLIRFNDYDFCSNCHHCKIFNIQNICKKSGRRTQDRAICTLHKEQDFRTIEAEQDQNSYRSGYRPLR